MIHVFSRRNMLTGKWEFCIRAGDATSDMMGVKSKPVYISEADAMTAAHKFVNAMQVRFH